MPTYEYACARCGCRFEEFQSITAKPLKKCPQCGEPALQRLIGTGAGIIFRGSGFYQTDYRSESYRKAAAAEKTGGSTASEKTSGTTSGEKVATGGSAAKGDSKSSPAVKTSEAVPATPAKNTRRKKAV